MELRGRVVKVANGKTVGVPNIKVKVVGESVDVTKTDGSFRLILPTGKSSVTIFLENCPLPMIDPYAGQVSLPYHGELQVRVCEEENNRLRDKISNLEGSIKKLEKERRFDERQLQRLHRTMLDTILFYEAEVIKLNDALSAENVQLTQKQHRLSELEQKVESLEQQLLEALQTKYLRQKELFDAIAAGLEEYLDQVKNLRDMVLPERVSAYFLNPGAREELYKVIEHYNAARNRILNDYEAQVLGVANLWSNPEVDEQLESTYQYLLEEVHKKGVYPLEFSVNDNLKQFLSNQKGRSAASKAAKDGASAASPVLTPYIAALEEKTRHTIQLLKEHI